MNGAQSDPVLQLVFMPSPDNLRGHVRIHALELSNRWTDNHDSNRTDRYAKCHGLLPSGYALNVIDQVMHAITNIMHTLHLGLVAEQGCQRKAIVD
jgi:hypothetical protein